MLVLIFLVLIFKGVDEIFLVWGDKILVDGNCFLVILFLGLRFDCFWVWVWFLCLWFVFEIECDEGILFFRVEVNRCEKVFRFFKLVEL